MRRFDRGDFLNALLYLPTASLPLVGVACLALDLHRLCWFFIGLGGLWMPCYCFLVWLWQPALMRWVNAPDAEASGATIRLHEEPVQGSGLPNPDHARR